MPSATRDEFRLITHGGLFVGGLSIFLSWNQSIVPLGVMGGSIAWQAGRKSMTWSAAVR